MECEEVRESLSAFLDGELNEYEREAVRAHVERCSDCARELTALRQVSALYRRLEDPEPPVDLEERVLAQVRRFRASGVPFWSRFSFPSSPKAVLAVAASVLVVCGAAVITARLIPSHQPVRLAKTVPEQEAPAMQLDAERAAADMKPVSSEPEVGPASLDVMKEKTAETKTDVAEVEPGSKAEVEELGARQPSISTEVAYRSADEQIVAQEVLTKPAELVRGQQASAGGAGVADIKEAAGIPKDGVPVAEEPAVGLPGQSEYVAADVSSKPVTAPLASPTTPARGYEPAAPSPAPTAMPQEAGETPPVEYEVARVEQKEPPIRSTLREEGNVIGETEHAPLLGDQPKTAPTVSPAPTIMAKPVAEPAQSFRLAFNRVIPVEKTFTIAGDSDRTPVQIRVVSAWFEQRSEDDVEVVLECATEPPGAAVSVTAVPDTDSGVLTLYLDGHQPRTVQVREVTAAESRLEARLRQLQIVEMPTTVTRATTVINAGSLAGVRAFSIQLKPVEQRPQMEDENDD